MPVYSLDRFSLFLVEDNTYVRNILESLLRHFQIGQIRLAGNGQEAIEYFQTVSTKPGQAGASAVDIVIADLLMAPINGLLLLRWLRTAEDSPNRFIPVVMLSGAADAQYVNAARDLGVTEFLAKPFSAESVYGHLLRVIDRPRQFVTTRHYFGPDRRRKKRPPRGEERRRTREEDVVIVYSADKVVKPKTDTDVWYFRLPNRLREKAAGSSSAGPGELPTQLLQEAEGELERASLDFTKWAQEYLGQLGTLCEEALATPGSRIQQFEKINLLAHELRGQGGTFGYPLVSTFGKMLYETTLGNCATGDNAVEIVKAHVDAMRAVIRDKIAGDGGAVGRELYEALQAAIEKHTAVE